MEIMERTILQQKHKSYGREYRHMILNATDLEAQNSYRVMGYATTFDERYVMYDFGERDKLYEMIDSKAFTGADMSDVVMLVNHDGVPVARTKNGSLGISIDGHGLLIDADLSLSEEARSLYEEIRTGLIDKMSWAFRVRADGEYYDDLTRTRVITAIERVFDVSAVTFPANDQTEIIAKRYMDSVNAEIEAKRKEMLQKINLILGGAE